jgi:hypothetical protein
VAEILLQPSHTASLLVAVPYLVLHCFVPLDRQIRNSDVQELTNMNCKRLRCYIVVDATLLKV